MFFFGSRGLAFDRLQQLATRPCLRPSAFGLSRLLPNIHLYSHIQRATIFQHTTSSQASGWSNNSAMQHPQPIPSVQNNGETCWLSVIVQCLVWLRILPLLSQLIFRAQQTGHTETAREDTGLLRQLQVIEKSTMHPFVDAVGLCMPLTGFPLTGAAGGPGSSTVPQSSARDIVETAFDAPPASSAARRSPSAAGCP